jgi:anti-sigma B factor antagonist
MIINQNTNGILTTLEIIGRLDTTTAPELEVVVDNYLADTQELVLDFQGLEYISSAGLRVLLKAQKSMMKRGKMKILNVNEAIMEVFEITGFSDILTIE